MAFLSSGSDRRLDQSGIGTLSVSRRMDRSLAL
jgi:hypothetical protein